MPKLILKPSDAATVIGPLATRMTFMVRSGAILMTTEAWVEGADTGFDIYAGSTYGDFEIGAGKTVTLKALTNATIQYEALS